MMKCEKAIFAIWEIYKMWNRHNHISGKWWNVKKLFSQVGKFTKCEIGIITYQENDEMWKSYLYISGNLKNK